MTETNKKSIFTFRGFNRSLPQDENVLIVLDEVLQLVGRQARLAADLVEVAVAVEQVV